MNKIELFDLETNEKFEVEYKHAPLNGRILMQMAQAHGITTPEVVYLSNILDKRTNKRIFKDMDQFLEMAPVKLMGQAIEIAESHPDWDSLFAADESDEQAVKNS